jgi:site-specific DNA-cytosine methylase
MKTNLPNYNLLSLFDGVSTALVASRRIGLKINKYLSSEIDPSAIVVQNHHYSKEIEDGKFVQLGDVRNVSIDDIPDDLPLICCIGFPCINLTSIGDRTGLNGENESSLFFEAIRILRELKERQVKSNNPMPIHFIIENVNSMENKYKSLITDKLKEVFGDEVKMLPIKSCLISASRRHRLYWNNIPGAISPEPIDIKFSDIIENGFVNSEKSNVVLSSNTTLSHSSLKRYLERKIGILIFKDQAFCELSEESQLKLFPLLLEASGHLGKAGSVKDEYGYVNNCFRHPSIKEYSRLLTFDDNYIDDVHISRTQKLRCLGLSMTVDVIAHLLKNLNQTTN